MTKEEYLKEVEERKALLKEKKRNRKPKIYMKTKEHKRNKEIINHLNKITCYLEDDGTLNLSDENILAISEARVVNVETGERPTLTVDNRCFPVVGIYSIFISTQKGTKSEIRCKILKRRNKLNNKKVEVNGISFDSKKESERYLVLLAMQEKGEIKNLSLQNKFELLPKQDDERPVHYLADFCYETLDGQTIVEDTKGFKTPDYIIKRKLFKYRYPNIIFTEL